MIELRHSVIRRGRHVVLAEATLPLPERGVIGVVGVNGAGKSTLFYALAQLLPRGAGSAELRPYTARPVAFAPQQPTFPEWLSVERVAQLYGFELQQLRQRYPALLLEEVSGKQAGSLSVGQRQALSVALAFAAEAPLMLLDEPFAPLDFRRRIGLVRLLQERRADTAKGLTLLSSQAATDLLDTCDWIVVLQEGQYRYSGAAAELTGGCAETAGARQRFEDAIMTLLGAAAPSFAQG